jgi:hypothetical protein
VSHLLTDPEHPRRQPPAAASKAEARAWRAVREEADARMIALHRERGWGPTRTVMCRVDARDCEWDGERWHHLDDHTPACGQLGEARPEDYTNHHQE